MSAGTMLRLPPSGDRVGFGAWGPIARRAPTCGQLADRLALRLGTARVRLHCSGRAALREALRRAAESTGRSEIVMPAYTCFSVPAAAVAAGLRVRLVDTDAAGRFDSDALAATPLDEVAAIVVCNLFGRAESIEGIVARARAAGVWVIDDAAQAFGATAPGSTGHAVGARGDLGVLSFGRGKPLSGLGGGALVESDMVLGTEADATPEVEPSRSRALIKAAVWDLALRPSVFSALARIPALGIGETPFEPAFATGAIDGASLVLADFSLDRAAADAERRAQEATRLADDLLERTRFEPILAEPGEHAVYPRLAVRAPDEGTRAAALAALTRCGAGASAFYPSALSRLDALRPHRVDAVPMPGAERLAGRLFTLPVHGMLKGRRWSAARAELARI